MLLRIYFIAVISILSKTAIAQNNFPELNFTDIKGAVKLTRPELITNGLKPLISEGLGYAAPAYYDWDGDGLKDLLIGEFATGSENGRMVGSFIRVYLNTGTQEQPAFTGKFDYARVPFKYLAQGNGTPYSVAQYCCIPFTPRFADLNGDGIVDMYTGQYQGEVSWFEGSKNGFHAGRQLDQEGDPRGDNWPREQSYWLYSSASIADLTGDGKPDLVIGGEALRISENIGSSSKPRFKRREFLLTTEGQPLKVYNYSNKELEDISKQEFFNKPLPAGDYATTPYVIDWDNDGVLDLLVTNSYAHMGMAAVDFFKGVKKDNSYVFKEGVPLFTPKIGDKALPGSAPFIFVTDWNNDGIRDLLIGCNVLTVRDEFSNLSWKWNKENNIPGPGKGAARLKRDYPAKDFREIIALEKRPAGVTEEEFMSMDHKGYVYVMLGSK